MWCLPKNMRVSDSMCMYGNEIHLSFLLNLFCLFMMHYMIEEQKKKRAAKKLKTQIEKFFLFLIKLVPSVFSCSSPTKKKFLLK